MYYSVGLPKRGCGYLQNRGAKDTHKRTGQRALTDRAVIFPLSHTETTKKTDHFWCVTKPNAFSQPMMFCINFWFEFYFPKCLLKDHLETSLEDEG